MTTYSGTNHFGPTGGGYLPFAGLPRTLSHSLKQYHSSFEQMEHYKVNVDHVYVINQI